MNNWNRSWALLDMTLGFPNKIRSDVKKKEQYFDQRTGEHVFVLEYRIKVNPGIQPPAPRGHRDPQPKLPTVPGNVVGPMAMIRELMDVRLVNTVDSSPSIPSGNRASEQRRKLEKILRKRGQPLQHPLSGPFEYRPWGTTSANRTPMAADLHDFCPLMF